MKIYELDNVAVEKLYIIFSLGNGHVKCKLLEYMNEWVKFCESYDKFKGTGNIFLI